VCRRRGIGVVDIYYGGGGGVALYCCLMIAVLPWNHGSPTTAAEVVHIFGDRAQGRGRRGKRSRRRSTALSRSTLLALLYAMIL